MTKQRAGWTAAMILVMEATGLARESSTEHRILSVTVSIRNDAGMSDALIKAAQTAAATIFSSAGVQLNLGHTQSPTHTRCSLR